VLRDLVVLVPLHDLIQCVIVFIRRRGVWLRRHLREGAAVVAEEKTRPIEDRSCGLRLLARDDERHVTPSNGLERGVSGTLAPTEQTIKEVNNMPEPVGARPAFSLGLLIRVIGIVFLVIAALMGFHVINADTTEGWGFLGLALCWVSTIVP
jgi:hypothetical protein